MQQLLKLLCIGFITLFVSSCTDNKSSTAQKEIVIGQTMPYSGPASAYGTIGRVHAAYFNMVNEQGGINGRKIKFISLDDGYTPPKTVEQVRRLVESDKVLILFQNLGTAPNTAIHKYVNDKKIPHLFVASGASIWNDPINYPWTMAFTPSYHAEGMAYAKYILQNKPDAKVGILYQNDDYGKDYLNGVRDGLGDKATSMIVAEESYEITDPTITSQIISLKGSGADTFINITTPKFAALAIKEINSIGWKPLHFLNFVSSSVKTVLIPAGLDASKDIITANFYKDPTDPKWKDDIGMKVWLAFMKKYYPEGNITDHTNVYGYISAQLLIQVLTQCGDDLSRENIMKQAANLKNVSLSMLLPGITANTSATDFSPFQQFQLEKFDGKQWTLMEQVKEF